MRNNHVATAALMIGLHAIPSSGPTVLTEVEATDARLSQSSGVTLHTGRPFTGRLVEHDGSGRLRGRTTYRHGLKDGVRERWWPNGRLAERRTYHDGLEHGAQDGWWEDGEPRFRYLARDGARHGLSYEWHRNGQVFTVAHYAGGREEGLQESWNPDGGLRYRYWQRDGRRLGQQGTLVCKSSREVMNTEVGR